MMDRLEGWYINDLERWITNLKPLSLLPSLLLPPSIPPTLISPLLLLLPTLLPIPSFLTFELEQVFLLPLLILTLVIFLFPNERLLTNLTTNSFLSLFLLLFERIQRSRC